MSELKKILLVDDEVDLLETTKETLELNGFAVEALSDPAQAKKTILENNFNLIISDFRMPQTNGLQLFEWVKVNRPTPFCMMTGFSDISSTGVAQDIGLSGFISKPFKSSDLIEMVKEACFDSAQSEDEFDGFSRVPIKTFISGCEVPYRIYARLGQEKFVKIAHTGESLSEDRLLKYMRDGVEYLYLKREDFKEFIGFHISIVRSVAASEEVSVLEKEKLIKSFGETLFEKAFVEGVDVELFCAAKEMIEVSIDALAENRDAFQFLSRLEKEGGLVFDHSLSVCIFSLMIARQVGYDAAEDQFKLAVASLFHDIGKIELGVDFCTDRSREVSREEQEVIDGHAVKGMEILSQIEVAPEEIGHLVLHHEDCSETAHWSDVQECHFLPLAHIVAVSNSFCNIVVESQKPPLECIEILCTREKKLNERVVSALCRLFNREPVKS